MIEDPSFMELFKFGLVAGLGFYSAKGIFAFIGLILKSIGKYLEEEN